MENIITAFRICDGIIRYIIQEGEGEYLCRKSGDFTSIQIIGPKGSTHEFAIKRYSEFMHPIASLLRNIIYEEVMERAGIIIAVESTPNALKIFAKTIRMTSTPA